jgi:hypothetical protein
MALKASHLALIAVALAVGAAHPEEASAQTWVDAPGCPVDASLLSRLVRIELASVVDAAADPGRFVVSLRCVGREVKVALADPLTSKSLERVVLAPQPDEPEPERLLALTVAQLYRASWLELTARSSEPAPLPPAVPPAANPVVLESARQLVSGWMPPLEPVPLRDFSLAVSGGLRARRLQEATLLPEVELTGSWAPTGEWFWFSVLAGIEAGSQRRAGGTLDVILGRFSGAIAIEPFAWGPWSGFGELTWGAALLGVSTSDVAEGYQGGSVFGAGFDGSLALGAAARVDPLRFELLGRFGVLEGTPTAIVLEDDDLNLDGTWAGLELRVRWVP